MKDVVVGLDVGTSKVCALAVGPVGDNGHKPAVLGYGVAPCSGLRKGVVVNIDATVEAIRAAVAEASRSAGVRIGSVISGLSGAHILGLSSHGAVGVRGGEVGARDVARVIEAARTVAIPPERQVIHVLPQRFRVDDQEGVRDPVGMAGVRLEANIHLVTAARTSSQTLARCCERAGVSPTMLVFEPLASAEAALYEEERELGAALVDIGGGTTDIAVFYQGAVLHTAVVPLGGSHLTNDLAAGLRTSFADAEQLKLSFGVATNLVVGREETVQVPGVGGRPPRPVPRRLLGEILGPRMEEILELARREMARAGVGAEDLVSGVVLVGGSSLLEGSQELAERIFNLPVRKGLPVNLAGLPEELMKPMYTTVAGLALYAAAGRLGRNGSRAGHRLAQRFRLRVSDWLSEFF